MCTYEDIEKANKSIKSTDIGRGKEYAEVPQRIKAFRMIHPNGAIVTDILSIENGVCIIKATVSDADGKVLGTGTAYEKEGSTFINKTSYIENCETSAVGRALAMCGLGIDTSVASKEEVENAINNQQKEESDFNAKVAKEMKGKATKAQLNALKSICTKHNINLEKIYEANNCTEDTLTEAQVIDLLTQLGNKYGEK